MELINQKLLENDGLVMEENLEKLANEWNETRRASDQRAYERKAIRLGRLKQQKQFQSSSDLKRMNSKRDQNQNKLKQVKQGVYNKQK